MEVEMYPFLPLLDRICLLLSVSSASSPPGSQREGHREAAAGRHATRRRHAMWATRGHSRKYIYIYFWKEEYNYRHYLGVNDYHLSDHRWHQTRVGWQTPRYFERQCQQVKSVRVDRYVRSKHRRGFFIFKKIRKGKRYICTCCLNGIHVFDITYAIEL